MSNQETFFEPQAVHDYFMAITGLAHPSANQEKVQGNEDPVRDYVNDLFDEDPKIPNVEVVFYNKTATEPGQRVIVLRRKGSEKYDGKKPLILQAHMDMVYNPVNMEFPLKVIVDTDSNKQGRWLKAKDKNGKDSTLGADDGIGVATALAILGDSDLANYPLECLFTVQEETDMGGAQNCKISNLTGEKLLNLDAETLNVIIFGSAGGSETSFQGNYSRYDSLDKRFSDGYTAIKLSLTGLRGGHSGVDINKGRLNAIKALTQVLVRLNKRITNLDAGEGGIGSYDYLLHDMSRLDVIKANAIPAEVEAVVVLAQADADRFVADFNAYCETLRTQNLPEEAKFKYAAVTDSPEGMPMDEKSTDTLLCLLQQIPYGVIKMIPEVPEVVETSTNLYNVEVKGSSVTVGSSNRSSNDMSLQALEVLQKGIGIGCNFMVFTDINSYSSWPPNKDSALLATASEVYQKIYDGKYERTVIHAGLECGVLVKRFKDELGKDLDAVSIGPTIKDPHSKSESLQVETASGQQTVQQFYDAVSRIVKAVFD